MSHTIDEETLREVGLQELNAFIHTPDNTFVKIEVRFAPILGHGDDRRNVKGIPIELDF